MIMKNGHRPSNSNSNSELREKFLARYMAAQTKHQKIVRRKKHRVVRPSRAAAPPKPPVLQPIRPVVKLEEKEPEPPQEEVLARDDEEPKPEDLAKEEATVKEVEEAAAVPEVDETPASRIRDRSAYDG